ncbi:hypothetical protein A9W98_08170 [Mycobacterium gordonae]|uniref:Uncharacterized protein n=1 Tax=Mycobacterium gordonae TaxID=1778 RepID=A0A1A6BN10_MYCGO|nr:hypothetical protein A9W98_08170 [Mycobacterium gordonae]
MECAVNRRIVDAMTITTAPECPTIAYAHLTDPGEAHRVIANARAQAPIALGPYGPEVTPNAPSPKPSAVVNRLSRNTVRTSSLLSTSGP